VQSTIGNSEEDPELRSDLLISKYRRNTDKDGRRLREKRRRARVEQQRRRDVGEADRRIVFMGRDDMGDCTLQRRAKSRGRRKKHGWPRLELRVRRRGRSPSVTKNAQFWGRSARNYSNDTVEAGRTTVVMVQIGRNLLSVKGVVSSYRRFHLPRRMKGGEEIKGKEEKKSLFFIVRYTGKGVAKAEYKSELVDLKYQRCEKEGGKGVVLKRDGKTSSNLDTATCIGLGGIRKYLPRENTSSRGRESGGGRGLALK